MSYKKEDLGKNIWKLTIEASAEVFEEAMQKAYLKNKGKINVQGFRKGKAPRALIEKMYGPGVFYEDAANEIIPEAYEEAAKDCGLEIVARPEIDVEQIEKGKEFIFTATVAVRPEVKLGKYKGLEVEEEKVVVTDEEVEAEINRVREQNSRMITVEDRPVQDGDTAVIDYEGFVDDVAFEGGKGENHSLVIGSHSFIDTFEDQIIGHNIGDEFDVNVNFPEEYHAEELKGKPAVFKVKVNEIKKKELPEVDDEFAQEVSEFDTLDEYKADILKNLTERKENEAKAKKEDALVDAIIAASEMDIPDAMIEENKRQMAEDMARRMQSQGLTLDMYLKYTGMTANAFMDQLKPQAIKRIQYRLVLEEVAKAEDIQVTDEELEKEIEDMAKMYQMEVDKLKELISDEEKDIMKKDIAVKKAIDFIRDNAK